MKNWQKIGIAALIILVLTLFFWPKECGIRWEDPFSEEFSSEKCSCIGFMNDIRTDRQHYTSYCYGICQKNKCSE